MPEHKLELWPGYTTSVVQCEDNVMLLSEISYKVVRNDTAHDLFLAVYKKVQEEGGDIRVSISNTALRVSSTIVVDCEANS